MHKIKIKQLIFRFLHFTSLASPSWCPRPSNCRSSPEACWWRRWPPRSAWPPRRPRRQPKPLWPSWPWSTGRRFQRPPWAGSGGPCRPLQPPGTPSTRPLSWSVEIKLHLSVCSNIFFIFCTIKSIDIHVCNNRRGFKCEFSIYIFVYFRITILLNKTCTTIVAFCYIEKS